MPVAPWIVSNALWERIEPLLPKVERRFRFPGRKRLPGRKALQEQRLSEGQYRWYVWPIVDGPRSSSAIV